MFINMDVFTPVDAAVGGALIGLSASLMLLLHGKIAGISGILGRLFKTGDGDKTNSLIFVSGLLSGGVLLRFFYPEAFNFQGTPDHLNLVFAGLLVGYGTQLGTGCTSGHGVCGLSRLSKRSLVATLCFMAFGFFTASGLSLLLG
jgi:uncharacterized protein